ncbi:MAG: isoprenyl transferase [Deltaproteobacteria bacterium]|nr:isoprenyl transferase [Candidatus Zymogenaceae bacterium]
MTGIKNLPGHVAIIMDGNGRWAKEKDLPRVEGHRKGSEVVREIVEASRKSGIKVLTLYAFSEENWNRPKAEVGALMSLLAEFLRTELPKMMDEHIRLCAVGRFSQLPDIVREVLLEAIRITKDNKGMTLVIALSYSGRGEIVDAVKEIVELAVEKKVTPEQIDEDMIARHLYTKSLPDPDLLIRTSGEKRISNFLLYQAAYTELFFTKTLWPDFTQEEFLSALQDYSRRERRYGMTSEQVLGED